MKKILYILFYIVLVVIVAMATKQYTLKQLQVESITQHGNEYTITAGHGNEWHTYTYIN